MTLRGREPGRPGPAPRGRRPADSRPGRSADGRPQRSGDGRPGRSGDGRPQRSGDSRSDRSGDGRSDRSGDGRPDRSGDGRPDRSADGRPGRSGDGRPRTGSTRPSGETPPRSGYGNQESGRRTRGAKYGAPPRAARRLSDGPPRRPEPARGRPGPASRPVRRPRRPPRWVRVRRAEPGRRLGITLLAIAFVLTMFGGRLVQIQGMDSGYYRSQAKKEQLTTLALPAARGAIYGADGQILAMTVETYTVTADPPQIRKGNKPKVAQQLSGPLEMPAQQVLDLLNHPTSPQYVVLKKGVAATQGAQITALDITGVYEQASYARVWPDGPATANVVGFTNHLNGAITGQAGIELAYNKLLSGTPGSEQVQTGAGGQPIPLAGSKDTPARAGTGIRLTIVPALQLEAEQACQQRVEQMHARQCTVVIIQPKTGYILAMAQWPTWSQTNVTDPTDLPVQDVFEPGSTAKVITAAAALERGGQTPMSAYYIPSVIYRGGQSIRDAEADGGSRYTIAGIIANSSNVGMSEVVSHVPPQVQYDYLRAFGLGQPTGLNMPGETQGILPPPAQWAPDERYTLSFGQGVAATAVQMASVYATIANNGVRVQPTLVEGTVDGNGKFTQAAPSPSRRVIQPKTARDLISILQQVPAVDQEADQPWGIISGYAVAAKTGTSQENGPNCSLCEYGSSYIGMAPGDNPQVVVAVNVQDPQKKYGYFGDVVAGPVFYHVMLFALQTLQIPPDGAVAPYVRLNAR